MSKLPSNSELNGFRRGLLSWYKVQGRSFPWRNKSARLYHRIIAEVLLQRTWADMIAAFYPRFIRQYPSWSSLAEARETDLRRFLKPVGLWRQKAASMTRLAREMAKRRGRFPRQRDQIESLPGVGQYIANAILLFAYGEPQPLLDVNMARLLERFFGPRKLADIRDDPYLQALSRAILDRDDPASVNWAVLDLAAAVCKIKEPECGICPLQLKCKYRQAISLGTPARLDSGPG